MLLYLLVLSFFCILYFLPVKLEIDYKRKKNRDYFNLALKVLFINHNLKLSFIDIKHLLIWPTTKLKGEFKSIFFSKEIKLKERVDQEELHYLIKQARRFYRTVKRFKLFFLLSHNCSCFLWKTSLGLKNPAYTGIVTGALWSIKSSIIAVIQNYLQFKKLPIIDVEPNFNKKESIKIEFKGIFEFRLGNIILIGIRISLSKIRRRIERRWIPIQLKD